MSEASKDANRWPARGFVDLCARPASTEEALLMLPVYKSMGFRVVVVEYAPFLDATLIEREAGRSGIQVEWRATIRAGRPGEIQRRLRDLRASRRHGIIAVAPSTVDAARFAARSRDIDLITIEPGMERLVDKSTSILFRQRGWGALEVVTAHLVEASRGPERRLEAVLRYFYLVSRKAFGYRIPLAASSCAETRWEIVHPYHVVGLATVPGIPPEESLSWMTRVPSAVLSRRLKERRRRADTPS